MKVIAKNTGNEQVDQYSAAPGMVVTYAGLYYLVARLPTGMFGTGGAITFINLVTGNALGDTHGLRFLVCDKAELHVSVLEV